MTGPKDLCEGCLHERVWHEGAMGCNLTEKDRLGFVREICECEKFVEPWVDDADYSEPFPEANKDSDDTQGEDTTNA